MCYLVHIIDPDLVYTMVVVSTNDTIMYETLTVKEESVQEPRVLLPQFILHNYLLDWRTLSPTSIGKTIN